MTSKNIKKLLYGSLIILALFFAIGGPIIHRKYTNWVKSHPQMYVYETYKGAVNPVLVIENIKYKDKLVAYYEQLKRDTSEPSFDFPPIILPENIPVYVVGFTSDSLLADIVSYYDRGRYYGGSYLRGYVPKETLHKLPPPR